MISASQIPDEVVEAAAKAIYYAWCAFHGVTKTSMPWDDVWGEERQACIAEAIASITAALSAWPGVLLYPPDVLDNTINPTRIILPLPQEVSDE